MNAITGPSDNGKTALLRAIRWVVDNKPTGDSFRSNWAGKEATAATLTIDGTEVHREKKGTTVNLYKMGSGEYKAFGLNVPEEIFAFLNLSPVNIQEQMDSPFLLAGLSPGEVGRFFNSIANIDKIDTAIRAANKDISNRERIIKHEKLKLDVLVAGLAEFEWIDEADGYLSALEVEKAEISALHKKRTTVHALSEKTNEIQRRIDPLEKILTATDEVNRLSNLQTGISRGNATWKVIDLLIRDIDDAERAVENCEALLKAHKEFSAVEHINNEMDLIKRAMKDISTSKERYIIAKNALDASEEYVSELEKEFDDAFPDICPLCGTEVK